MLILIEAKHMFTHAGLVCLQSHGKSDFSKAQDGFLIKWNCFIWISAHFVFFLLTVVLVLVHFQGICCPQLQCLSFTKLLFQGFFLFVFIWITSSFVVLNILFLFVLPRDQSEACDLLTHLNNKVLNETWCEDNLIKLLVSVNLED